MKYQRIFFVLSVPILVLFIIALLILRWSSGAEFPGYAVLGLVVLACIVLAVLTAPGRGLFQTALRLIVLSRNMWDHRYGARPLQPGEGSGAESTKAHRKFASTAGGHTASLVGHLTRLVMPGIGGRTRLMAGPDAA